MTSPLLALFLRSVREDTRAKSTYWVRGGLAAFMLVVMAMAALRETPSGVPGLDFLQTVAWLHVIFLTASGVGWFASAITEEKEEETLDLLCMTNLSPLSILLGKSTSRLWGALLLIVAQLPFTLLAVTLGGVSRGQVFAVYATLTAYTFFLCNLALLASVLARRTGVASLLTAAVLFAAWVVGSFVPAVAALSPFARLTTIFATGFAGPPVEVQVVGDVLAGGVSFGVAWAVFRHFCETPSRGEWTTATTRRHGWFSPGRPALGAAVAWKDFHFLHGGHPGSAVRALVYLTVLLTYAFGGLGGLTNWLPSVAHSDFLLLGALVLVAELAFGASRIFGQEIADQTLSSLSLTPLSLIEIVRAKVRASYRSALPGAVCLAGGLAATVLSGLPDLHSSSDLLIALVSLVLLSGGLAFFLASQISFSTHLIAYLSLRLHRGAFPIGIAVCVLANLLGFSAFFGPLWFFYLPFPCFALAHILRGKSLLLLRQITPEN